MRQLLCTAAGEVGWHEVDSPSLEIPSDALIEPVVVARCEIDPFLVFAGPGQTGPFALGHEAVARVRATGDQVGRFRVGDMVICSFQVSCGSCVSCLAGHTANCDEYPTLSDYGMASLGGTEYGGMLADLVRVPHADVMLQPVPGHLDPVALPSLADNVLDGYRAVAPHLRVEPHLATLVACHGTPSIGLYAAQSALALGAESVTVASDHPAVLACARRIGADTLETDFVGRPPVTAPLVVDCGVDPSGLSWAIRATAPEGTLHSVSYYATSKTVPIPLGRLYTLGINFHIGRANAVALLPEVLALVADGTLRPGLVTSQVLPWDDASTAFTEPSLKQVYTRL